MSGTLFIASIIGVIGGILCRFFSTPVWSLAALFGVFGFVFIVAYAVKRREAYALLACATVVAALILTRLLFIPSELPSSFVSLVDTKVSFEGTIVSDPDIRDSNQHVVIEVEKEGEATKILAFAPLFPKLAYGERVEVSGKLKYPEPFTTDGGRTFAYDEYLAKDGIFSLISYAEVTVLEEPEGFFTNARGFLYSIKHAFVDALMRALPQAQAALASGLIAGGKQGLGDDLLEAFTIAGLLPIIVLSGYNVMIVADWIRKLFGFLPKRFSILLSALAVAAFVLAAGGGSSAVRAGFMAGLALFARVTNRTYVALRALAAVFIGMLFLNPLLLLNDPGFQFSFVATLGLILGTPIVERRLLWIKNEFLREIAATTVAAQIAVLPLLLYQTGNLSLVSLLANVLVLPFVPLTMLLSFLAALVSFVVPNIAPLAGAPAFVFLSYIIGVGEISASLPYAHLIVYAFPFWIVIGLYLLIAYIFLELCGAKVAAVKGTG
ncbi:MAG: competence protein ComEC [Parcubacteria bacterium C7867-001]|nr:MAG: competence protein ComEC [Parcubacteria bacterium C7867-001]